jgi:hypothetical protein
LRRFQPNKAEIVRCCATLTAEGSGEIPLLKGPAAAAAAKEEEEEEEARPEPGPPIRLDGDSCNTN